MKDKIGQLLKMASEKLNMASAMLRKQFGIFHQKYGLATLPLR